MRNIDLSGSIGSDILSYITYAILLPFPTTFSTWVSASDDINDFSINFEHSSEGALWGLTFNGIQEANDYAVTDGLTSYSPLEFKKLQVICHYSNNKSSSSAPMLSYIGSGLGVGVTNIIFHTLGISSLIDIPLEGFSPDIIITQRETNPIDSDDLRATVYHEYGHSLHYFKANKFSNAHWLYNITQTIAKQIISD